MKKAIVVAAAFAVAATSWAQEWTVEIKHTDNTKGGVSTNGAVYSSRNQDVQVSASVSFEKCKSRSWRDSHFSIAFPNQGARLYFPNVTTEAVEAGTVYSLFRNGIDTPPDYLKCRFPKATGSGLPACLGEFIRDPLGHPQLGYQHARVLVDFNDVDFTSMPENIPFTGLNPAKVQIEIRAKTDCSVSTDGAGLATEDPPDSIKVDMGAAKITRLSPTEWKIDVQQRIPTLQYGHEMFTSTSRKQSSTVCGAYISTPTIWTNPMSFSIYLKQE